MLTSEYLYTLFKLNMEISPRRNEEYYEFAKLATTHQQNNYEKYYNILNK